ncbi:laccase-1 [Neltuma alba]|uniref:laccase-1 n=1 Tax=Neltuma alba TaxID=207710 RepID=UPI0010A5471A|nr:laccase-1 [Prosopis alba]
MEGLSLHYFFSLLMVTIVALEGLAPPYSSTATTTKIFQFNVEWKNVTRLCHSRPLLTVNGEYPGPTIAVHEGDNVLIKVTNRIARNTTIHWHGVRQIRTGWADGPAYITQCPIKGGTSYTYNFTVLNQRGTLFWHAHYSWQRASVCGAFIIYPRMPYPFSAPIHAEVPIILGEWWNVDAEMMASEMMKYGSGPNYSDAYTINGLPGPLYPCSVKDTFTHLVERGKTYLLRIINAALSDELFFAVASHTMAVVEVDATYTKPYTTRAIMVTPGQTTNVLLTADQIPDSSGMFVVSARPYRTSVFPFNNSTTVGFLRYKMTKALKGKSLNTPTNLANDNLPEMENTDFARDFFVRLRSLASTEFPCMVPKQIDKRVITTIGLNLQDCPANKICTGLNNKSFLASMNNQSFVRPSTSLLESYYMKRNTGEYSFDFPEKPPKAFNYTGVDPLKENMNAEFGTKVIELEYGTNLEMVLQDTGFLNVENHPIHVHGHNFFIVGGGFGNYDVEKDPENYNLVDPPERNTVGVPSGGWAAIRLKADNPGAWFVHCHLEEHTSWGLAMAFIVKDGSTESKSLLPPPQDLPSC